MKFISCQQMGHYKSHCPNPTVDEDAANITENGVNGGYVGFGRREADP